MKKEIENWEEKEGVEFLRKVGIKHSQTVLDFGCGIGHYAIPAAKIVGRGGKVYALDKNPASLDELMEKAKEENLENIKRVDISNELKILLKKESIDVVLLYDVVHLVGENDSSTVNDRKKLYQEVYRVAKNNALISVYPTHLTTHTDITSNEEIRREIEEAGFKFEKELSTILIHDNNMLNGIILNFRKT